MAHMAAGLANARMRQQPPILSRAEEKKMLRAASGQARFWANVRNFFFRLDTIAFMSILVWLIVGTTFYTIRHNWTVAQGAFYTLDTGLSVGAGSLAEGETVSHRNLTLSLVSSSGATATQECYWPREATPVCVQQEFSAGSSITVNVSVAGTESSTFVPDETSMLFTVFHVMCGASFIGAALGIFATVLVSSSEEWKEEEEGAVKQKRNMAIMGEEDLDDRIWNAAVSCVTGLRDGIKAFIGPNQNLFILLCLWVTVGTLFGFLHLKLTVVQSIYYAVTAMSTGGHHAPDTDDASMWFTAIYFLTGVPLFGMTLGAAASICVEAHARAELDKAIKAKLTAEDFEYANSLDDTGDTLDFTEYLILSLTRLGRLDKQLKRKIKSQFEFMDISGDGEISKEEMNAMLMFGEFDWDDSGHIGLEEFTGLVLKLASTPGPMADKLGLMSTQDILTAFNDIDDSGNGSVDPKEFVQWFRTLNDPGDGADAKEGEAVADSYEGKRGGIGGAASVVINVKRRGTPSGASPAKGKGGRVGRTSVLPVSTSKSSHSSSPAPVTPRMPILRMAGGQEGGNTVFDDMDVRPLVDSSDEEEEDSDLDDAHGGSIDPEFLEPATARALSWDIPPGGGGGGRAGQVAAELQRVLRREVRQVQRMAMQLAEMQTAVEEARERAEESEARRKASKSKLKSRVAELTREITVLKFSAKRSAQSQGAGASTPGSGSKGNAALLRMSRKASAFKVKKKKKKAPVEEPSSSEG